MTLFRKKPIVVSVATWGDLIAHGINQCERNGIKLQNGMPWHFDFNGHPITHENDQCYLIQTLEGTHNMTPNDVLITGVKGEIYPCKINIFLATYEKAE